VTDGLSNASTADRERAAVLAGADPAAAPHDGVPADEIVSIFGVPFSAISYEEALRRVREMLRGRDSHQIVIANAHTLNIAYRDPEYRRTLQQVSLVLRDGAGVELAGVLKGRHFAYNFIGTDFVPRLLGDLRVGVFLYGSAPGVAAGAARALQERNPALHILGVEHGYADAQEVVARVAAARPDVLLVALGNPLQERWIASNLPRLNARVAVGVGALFDNLAGRVPRAPLWLRRMRCEWIFRLCIQPGRLWRRYLIGNPLFLWRLATTAWKERA
jgi:exopolysaccharide biosynthesis WecB/TagA/CpsF family protein